MALEKMVGEHGQEITIELDESTLRHILALSAAPVGTVTTEGLHEEGFFSNVEIDPNQKEV